MKKAPAILPKNMKILKDLGEHIQLARLRRKLSAEQIAERTGLGRKTIYNIEQGNPNEDMGLCRLGFLGRSSINGVFDFTTCAWKRGFFV